MKKVKTFGITNENEDSTQITVTFDFAGVTEDQLADWALSNRVIAFQTPCRKLAIDEIRALNNTTVMALDCGKKVESRSEKIAKYVAMGFNEEIATIAVDNPTMFTELVNQVTLKE
jgi:hypothetical protein